jgi:hypothetical protein
VRVGMRDLAIEAASIAVSDERVDCMDGSYVYVRPRSFPSVYIGHGQAGEVTGSSLVSLEKAPMPGSRVECRRTAAHSPMGEGCIMALSTPGWSAEAWRRPDSPSVMSAATLDERAHDMG